MKGQQHWGVVEIRGMMGLVWIILYNYIHSLKLLSNVPCDTRLTFPWLEPKSQRTAIDMWLMPPIFLMS